MGRRLVGVPYAWGESPFRIKGLGYRGHVEHTNQHVQGGLSHALALANDPQLTKFFSQPFLASSWYDVFPLVELGLVCCELVGKPYRQYLEERTRLQAHSDLSSVYHQLLLWLATPASVARRIPSMMSRYFDFAPALVLEEAQGSTRGMCQDFPAPLLTWYQPVATTWFLEALRMAGAQEPQIDIDTRPSSSVHPSGIQLVEVHWQLRWSTR